MAKFQRYDSYKDSGVEWIGEIPKHWEVEKGKWLFKQIKRPVRQTDEIVTCFRDGQVTLRANRRIDGFTNALKEYGYQGVRKGDLVIHVMDAFAGSVGVSDSDGKATPVYSVCIPWNKNMVYCQYYAMYLRNLAIKGFLLSLAKGIRERSTDFRFKDFGELEFPLPPKDEQEKIASYLDEKIAKIDTAISGKEKLIELLKEQKQIIINDAVTKGLNKNAEFKDSGVEWIGQIPKHWEVMYGFRVFNENKRKNVGMLDNRVLSLSYGQIIRKPEEKLVGLVPESFETYQIVKNGDIIVRCTDLQNDKVSLRIGLSKYDGIITNAYLNLNVINGNPKYLYYFLYTFDATKAIYQLGSGLRQGLSYKDFKKLNVLLPPQSEQEQIVEYIENKTNKIDKLVNLQQEYIERLKEYKTSLIDSVVTGKVKV